MFTDLQTWVSKLDNSDKIALLAIIVPIIFTIIFSIMNLIVMLTKHEEIDARKKLRQNARVTKIELRGEGMFFREGRPKWRFSRSMPVYNKNNGKKPRILRGSFVVTGEAGCGKSAFLQENFIRAFWLQWGRIWPFSGRNVYWLNAQSLNELLGPEQQEMCKAFLDRLKTARLSRLYLYVDGLDEIRDESMKDFHEFLGKIRGITSVILRVSCRTEFFRKHLANEYFDCRLTVGLWNPDQLLKLATMILNNLNHPNLDRVRKTKNYINGNDMPWDFIHSPLLLKLLLYIKLYSSSEMKEPKNKFKFYSDFFNTILGIYQSRHEEIPAEYISLDNIAEQAFSAYVNGKKEIPYNPCLLPLTKTPSGFFQRNSGQDSQQNSQPKVCLTHESFYEYLIARHYRNQFIGNSLGDGAVGVLQTPYSNDYADFITDAFTGESENSQSEILHSMAELYSYTLSPEYIQAFRTQFGFSGRYEAWLSPLLQNIETASLRTSNPFLTIKYEIVFRFGRFSTSVDEAFRISFLKFIYDHDCHTAATFDKPYFEAVLKRCCAISSSFLGGERIELDYVRHMTGISAYNENYDLANRSHTLIYYGDVPESNIYTFRDDAAQKSWSFSRGKRINRLKHPLPDKIAEMNDKQKRYYRFRLFDLATIYTFLKSRPLYKLSTEEQDVLKNAQIYFVDMSQERRLLLRELKQKILELLN